MRCIINSPPCWRRRTVRFTNACLQHQNLAQLQYQQHKNYLKYKQPKTKRPHCYLNNTLETQLTFVKNMSTGGNSLTTTDIKVRVIKPHECQKVLDFLRKHYYLEEPLTVGCEPPQQDKEDEDFNMSNVEHGTCLMATIFDKQNGQDRIVGALLAGPKGPDEADHLFEQAARLGPTKWGHTLQFLACIERDANIYERFQVKNVLQVHVIGVDSEMRGKNVGSHLLTEAKNLAKKFKYEMISADCTSFYSARLFERMGFDCINTKYYREYLNENGKQVFQPKPPHECVKTFALKL